MRVLLISANREEINMPTLPLGLACVATATEKAGHQVKCLDMMAESEPWEAIKKAIETFVPEAIGISVRNIDDQTMEKPRFLLKEAAEVIEQCRQYTASPIILGGAGYSIFPEAALDYLGADMGIQGEGEVAFPALLDCIEKGISLSDVAGLYLPSRGLQRERLFIDQLDTLHLPDSSFFSVSSYGFKDLWIPVQSRRGCPLRCSYCSTESVEGARIRKRSVDVVVWWMNEWAQKGIDHFYFVDNTFNLPPSYATALCKGIMQIEPNISWRCILYPKNLDRKLVETMAKSGCKEVSLGFESGCESILEEMNKRFSLAQVRETNTMLADFGIGRMGFLLLGGPGETRQSVEESLTFADSLRLDFLKITIGIRIYPYTRLAARAVEDGLIQPDDNLLQPKFYITKGLKEWLIETVNLWAKDRPNWIT